MKYLAYIASLTALASTMQAADVTIQGKAGRATITGVTSADTLILDSSVSPEYSAGGVTVNKLISTNGAAKGDVNLANIVNFNAGQGITVDANTASGEFTAIDVNSWRMNLATLTVKNSASATNATVNVNFGSLLNVNSGENTQNQYVYFDSVKANVTASETTIGNNVDKGSVLGVKSTADVNWNGNITLGESGTLDVAGKFTTSGNLSSKTGSKINLTGTMTTTYASAYVLYSTITSTGKFVQNSSNADAGITLSKDANMNSGSDWTLQGKLMIQNNSTTTVNEGAYLTFVPNTLNKARVILGNGSIVLNQANALRTNAGEPNVSIVTINTASHVNNIFANADQELFSLYVNEATMNIYLDDLVKISLTSATDATIDYAGSGNLNIFNFQEDNFYVGTKAVVKQNVESIVSLYDGNGEYLGAATVNDLGYITLLTGPEPAEWAAIFGALALGLAMYRRRK